MSDAILRLIPSRSRFGDASLRFRRRLERGALVAEALSPGRLGGPLPERSDLIGLKSRVDVVVEGFAFAPSRAARESHVRLRARSLDRRAQVFGPRTVGVSDGRPFFSAPAPFDRIPLTNDMAYGGIDRRVGVPEGTVLTPGAIIDHPGLYPRNREGRGYSVFEPEEGLELPCLENPSDLITPERLAVGDPRDWHRMPLPMSFDWLGPITFPRCRYLGFDAWFPAPPDEALAESKRGLLERPLPPTSESFVVYPSWAQEAQVGSTLDALEPGDTFVFDGMHPTKPTVTLVVPPPPVVVISVDGRGEEVPVRPQTVIARPHEESLSIVYVAARELPRALIVGVHKRFPVTAMIDGGEPILCTQPTTTAREELERLSRA